MSKPSTQITPDAGQSKKLSGSRPGLRNFGVQGEAGKKARYDVRVQQAALVVLEELEKADWSVAPVHLLSDDNQDLLGAITSDEDGFPPQEELGAVAVTARFKADPLNPYADDKMIQAVRSVHLCLAQELGGAFSVELQDVGKDQYLSFQFHDAGSVEEMKKVLSEKMEDLKTSLRCHCQGAHHEGSRQIM